MEIEPVQQINGDIRIDDIQEDAPLLKIEFFAEFASLFSNEEKYRLLDPVILTLEEILKERSDALIEVPRRREAILAQRKAKLAERNE